MSFWAFCDNHPFMIGVVLFGLFWSAIDITRIICNRKRAP